MLCRVENWRGGPSGRWLGCVPGFPLRARLAVSVAPFPAPATSHAACGFPALRAPAHSQGYGKDLSPVNHSNCWYNQEMEYEWDENKCEANLAKHDVDFDTVRGFDWQTAQVFEDLRFDYGERRFWALGLIEDRLHVLAFTLRDNAVRVISLRKANRREVTYYG